MLDQVKLPTLREFLIGAAVITFFVLAGCSRGHTSDWNRGGFSMNHQERVYVMPGVGFYALEPRQGPQLLSLPYVDEAAAREKALRDQVTCNDIVMYTDAGIVRSRPDGCRR